MSSLVVFASGNGSNFEAIVKAIKQGKLKAKLVGLICDQPEAYCMIRAQNHQVPTALFLRNTYPNKVAMDKAILQQVLIWQADWLILAGYMRLLTPILLHAFPKRIVNIHPSLLPHYKGKDALGQALAAHETTLGISIHYVDEGMDTGALIAQISYKIKGNETRSEIESHLHQLEHEFYPRIIQQLIKEQV